MNYQVCGNELNISVDKNIYSEDVLFKCFYWYGKNYSITITGSGVDSFLVNIKPFNQDSLSEEEWADVIKKISQDLIDFKLRDIVTRETKTIRELIIAKAFAYYEPGQSPSSEISDPVGFSPQN